MTLHYGFGKTCVGRVVVVFTQKGLCALRLVDNDSPGDVVQQLQRAFPRAELVADDAQAQAYVRQADEVLEGRLPSTRVKLDPQGTDFQKRVWQALVRVPWGRTCSYSELAQQAGSPRAVRAVASACARNPVALVVPCHRILRNNGGLGGYFYGLDKKRELLDKEKGLATLRRGKRS